MTSVKKKWHISNWKITKQINARLDTIFLPGFQGQSVLYVSRFFFEAIWKGKIATRAAAISFRLFLAFFPSIILLLSLIPYIPIDHFQQSLFDSLRDFFPGDTFQLFDNTLKDLISQKRTTLLSIGFVLVIFYASNSINAVLIGFNESFHIENRHHPIMMRLSSIFLIFFLGVLMLLAVLILAFSGDLFEYLHKHQVIGDRGYFPILNTAKWVVSTGLIYSIISTLYNVGARRSIRRWKFWNAGATLATISFVVTSGAFAFFVNNFATYNKLYGSLGTLMVLLIWLHINCMIVLMGFDLNVSIRKAFKSIPKPAPLEAPTEAKNAMRGS
ncbi:MAG: YihY/virulence factor BrkB family protein [Flavobacteriales bacterium]